MTDNNRQRAAVSVSLGLAGLLGILALPAPLFAQEEAEKQEVRERAELPPLTAQIPPEEALAAIKRRAKKILEAIPADHPDRPNLTKLTFYEGGGCPACLGIGYKGRIGIYEIMVMNKEIEAVILSGQVSEYVMQEIALKNGMITMAQDGLIKALKGVTSAAEVFRVSE